MLGIQRNTHTNASTAKIKLGRHVNDKKSIRLFQHVVYLIDNDISDQQRKQLVNILNNNGGSPANDNKQPNLYVSQSRVHPVHTVISVTPLWVEKAIVNGFVHETQYYIPGKNQFLSGEVLLLLDLPDDNAAIFEQIEKHGGQYRDDITEDLTCLVCIEPRGVQYSVCKERDIPAVLPQWLDDCLLYHHRLNYQPYRFPSPSIYYQHNPRQPTIYPYPSDKKVLPTFLPSLLHTSNDEFGPTSTRAHLFKNEIIYFGKDIMADQRKLSLIPILANYIKRAGGHVLSEYNHHLVTIVILKYRSSLEYRQALKDGKWVATFWWLTNTLARGYLCSPMSTLLDYPVPKVGIPDMHNCVITLTGFKGAARSFLSVLILVSGAKISVDLREDTTHLICGGGYGSKYAQLSQYPNVIKVNHLWLEECYTHWKKLDHTKDPRYTYIPKDNALLADTVGKTTLLKHVVDRWKNDAVDVEPTVIYDQENRRSAVSNSGEVGYVREHKPRKAALRALTVLNDIVMPDVNAYEKENRKGR